MPFIPHLRWRNLNPQRIWVPSVEPPLTKGDPGFFGLYLAMREHAELSENADPGKRSRWVLAGPPPGFCTAQHAAYDPETYEIICFPDRPIPPERSSGCGIWSCGKRCSKLPLEGNALLMRENAGVASVDVYLIHRDEIVICGHNAVYAAACHYGQVQGVAGK